MRPFFYAILAVDDELYAAVVPQTGDHKFTPEERRLVIHLLGPDADLVIDNIWNCGSDANVQNRLAVQGFEYGSLAHDLMQWAYENDYLGEEDDEEDD